MESFSCGRVLVFLCHCWFIEVLSTVFITFFIFSLQCKCTSFSVIFEMADVRQHVYSIQSINYTNWRIMRRKQKEKKMGGYLREIGVDAACPDILCRWMFTKGKTGPKLSNPDTPALGLLRCCIVVASCFFHLYKVILSVWSRKVPVALLVRSPYLQ